MNAYEKAQQLNLTGTDAEIVSVLQTLSQTDIKREDLSSWLARNALLDYDGQWFGLLQKLIDGGAIAGPLLGLIRQLKSIVLGVGGVSLRTTDPKYAVDVYRGLAGIAGVSAEAAALCATFYDTLASGRPHKDLTEAWYTAQRQTDDDRKSAAIVSQQSLQYLASKVAARDAERQKQLQPILDARIRDNELVQSLTDRIAVAARDGQTLLVTQADVDAMIGGA